MAKQCRTVDIMADAAYAILTRPKTFTGNFVVDEDILREEGVQDMDQYAVQPGHRLTHTHTHTRRLASCSLTLLSDWSAGHPLLPD